MNNKNSSQDFAIKKEFIDLQLELKKFMDESELFTLQDFLKDPFVVHSLEDHLNAYKEAEDIKKIQKVLKKLLKYKKKSINLNSALQNLQKQYLTPKTIESKNEPMPQVSPKTDFNINGGFFSLKQVNLEKELSKEKMLQIFKTQFKRIETLRKIPIPKVIVNRNFSVSTSHSQLLKKIEKNTDLATQKSPNNEITSNSATFRNGVMRNNNLLEKLPKIHHSPGVNILNSQANIVTNVVKATRSPHQSNKMNNLNDKQTSIEEKKPLDESGSPNTNELQKS